MRPLSELDAAYLAAHAQSRDLHRPVVGLPPVEMRVLTVRQPHATAIVRMGKDVENRSRNIAGDYRGPVAIHAGLHEHGRRGQRTTFDNELEVERDISGLLLRSPRLAWPYRLPLGAIIGVVDLVDVHDCLDCLDYRGPFCSPWAMDNLHHLVLANPRPLARPIPAKGRLGLWRPDPDLLAQIQNQIEETP